MNEAYLFKGEPRVLEKEKGDIRDGAILLPSEITIPIREAGLRLLPKYRKTLYRTDFLDGYHYYTEIALLGSIPDTDQKERLMMHTSTPVDLIERINQLWLPLPEEYKALEEILLVPHEEYFFVTDKIDSVKK